MSPELLQWLEQKANASCIPLNSWEGYATLLRYLQAAALRIPSPEELDAMDIDNLFTIEMRYLAETVDSLFSEEGFEELASYLYDPLHLP